MDGVKTSDHKDRGYYVCDGVKESYKGGLFERSSPKLISYSSINIFKLGPGPLDLLVMFHKGSSLLVNRSFANTNVIAYRYWQDYLTLLRGVFSRILEPLTL